jgi:hypothetical protein
LPAHFTTSQTSQYGFKLAASVAPPLPGLQNNAVPLMISPLLNVRPFAYSGLSAGHALNDVDWGLAAAVVCGGRVVPLK